MKQLLLLILVTAHCGFAQLAAADEVAPGVYSRIVINDAIGGAGSRAYASPFDAVVSLSFGGSYCTGTLIASDTILTARHCQAFVGDDIVFGTDLNNPAFVATVASVFDPAGNGSLLDGGDLSILRLTSAVPTAIATPMRLTNETTSLVGQEVAMIGYGYNGLGSVGHQFSSDDMRWGGTNILDRYGSPAGTSGSNIFSTDFDDGSEANNTIAGSDRNPLEFEATTAPGDSGGPMLVRMGNEWVVAGVLSGGTTSNSVYGDISWWTGVAPFQSQIEANGGIFFAVPEPASGLLLVVGMIPFVLRRRR